MKPTAPIASIAISLLLIVAAGSVSAASNTNALLGASDPVVLELGDTRLAKQSRTALTAGPVISAPIPSKVIAQRLPSQQNPGFDWTTLISMSFGILGLLWIRRRSADL